MLQTERLSARSKLIAKWLGAPGYPLPRVLPAAGEDPPMRRWVRQGLRYAPAAALIAVLVTEIAMTQGHLVYREDARIFRRGGGAGVLYAQAGPVGHEPL